MSEHSRSRGEHHTSFQDEDEGKDDPGGNPVDAGGDFPAQQFKRRTCQADMGLFRIQ
jgi:hypothetical protein